MNGWKWCARETATPWRGRTCVSTSAFRYDPATGDFDHHQAGLRQRAGQRVRYASFGLVWREFGARVCAGDHEWPTPSDQTLVQSVDANDTASG